MHREIKLSKNLPEIDQVKRKKFKYNSASSLNSVPLTSSEEISDIKDQIKNEKEEEKSAKA